MSDAIVCTAFIASATSIRENVNSTAILVDEAARLTEPELWPVLGGWYRPKALILVGDHHHTQLSHHTSKPRHGIPLLYLEVSTECQGSRRRYAVHARLRHDGHAACPKLFALSIRTTTHKPSSEFGTNAGWTDGWVYWLQGTSGSPPQELVSLPF